MRKARNHVTLVFTEELYAYLAPLILPETHEGQLIRVVPIHGLTPIGLISNQRNDGG